MPGVDVHQGKAREELANDGDRLIGDVSALRAPDEECRLREPHLVGVFIGEIAEVVERLAQDAERDSKLARLAALGRVQVLEEELADRKFL